MARWFLVLLLTVAVGTGVVGTCADGPCAVDDCAAAADHDDEGDACGDDGDGAEHGADDCPPLCGGCPRVAAEAPARAGYRHVALMAATTAAVAPSDPITAPPLHGLFRPPRA